MRQMGRGFREGGRDFVELECRRDYKVGGLVHVYLLQRRLENVVEALNGEHE